MRILSINTSERKGTHKIPVAEAQLKVDVGIVGDSHAGPGIRQISFLAKESHNRFQEHTDVNLVNGIFGENITTEGIDLRKLKIGDRLSIGDSVIEISKIGKECHNHCAISARVGECIMPKECVFGIVKKEGTIKPDDKIILE